MWELIPPIIIDRISPLQLSTRNRYPDNAEEHSSYEEQSTCKDPSLQDSNGTDEEPSFSPELRLPQRDNRAKKGSYDIHR